MPFKPGLHLGMLVGGVVVDDQMELPPGRGAIDLVEKADEFTDAGGRRAPGSDRGSAYRNGPSFIRRPGWGAAEPGWNAVVPGSLDQEPESSIRFRPW